MTDADVAAVLDGAVLGEFEVWQATCPVCSDPKSTQIYARDGRMIFDHACRCSPKSVRARKIMALYADRYGRELPELLTPSEAAKAANGHADREVPWGEIDESLLEGARGTVPAFPLHVLPPLWAQWVKSSAEASGTSNDYLAQGLFACVAAICGAGVAVEITPDWHEPLVLWQALVGSPSTGKSPAMTAAHFLLDPIEKDAGAGDPERKRALETKIEEAKISAEKWRTECAAAIKAGTPSPLKPEAAMFNVRFVPTQIVVADTTIEALADVVFGNSRGVALWRDELYAWLANFGRYANGGTDLRTSSRRGRRQKSLSTGSREMNR